MDEGATGAGADFGALKRGQWFEVEGLEHLERLARRMSLWPGIRLRSEVMAGQAARVPKSRVNAIYAFCAFYANNAFYALSAFNAISANNAFYAFYAINEIYALCALNAINAINALQSRGVVLVVGQFFDMGLGVEGLKS